MTNHQQKTKFKPTVMTPELEKELADPKGWVTGRLLPKRSKAKNKKMVLKGKGKSKPTGRGKKKWAEKDDVPKEEDVVITPDGVKTEEEVEEEVEEVVEEE